MLMWLHDPLFKAVCIIVYLLFYKSRHLVDHHCNIELLPTRFSKQTQLVMYCILVKNNISPFYIASQTKRSPHLQNFPLVQVVCSVLQVSRAKTVHPTEELVRSQSMPALPAVSQFQENECDRWVTSKG